MGQGIFVRNTQFHVRGIFTDSLSGCVQLILRNDQVTFCGHINSTHGGRMATWAERIVARFTERYGAPTFGAICSVLFHEGSAQNVERAVKALLNDASFTCMSYYDGGMFIRLVKGDFDHGNIYHLGPTPNSYNTSSHNVAGSQTAPDLIAEIFQIDDESSNIAEGDYHQDCPVCRARHG